MYLCQSVSLRTMFFFGGGKLLVSGLGFVLLCFVVCFFFFSMKLAWKSLSGLVVEINILV